jgi:hypothetical protein
MGAAMIRAATEQRFVDRSSSRAELGLIVHPAANVQTLHFHNTV